MGWVRQLQCSLYLTLISLLSTASAASSITMSMSLPGCPDKCGNITIPYPFGTRPECYRDVGFQITCDESATPRKAVIGSGSGNEIELMDINIITGEARAIQKYINYVCYDDINSTSDYQDTSLDLSNYPTFLFSNQRNKFTAIGCYTKASIAAERGKNDSYFSGCISYCKSPNSTTDNGDSCNGLGCCQTAIPAGLNFYEVQWDLDTNYAWDFNPCNYAFLAEENWYKFQVQDLSEQFFLDKTKQGVQFVLDWAIRDNGTCQNGVENSTNRACVSNNSTCNNTSNGNGYICQCNPGYEGNPYIRDGCKDIDECNSPNKKNPCSGICKNTNGSFMCSCKGFFTRGKPLVGHDTICNTDTARVATYPVLGVGVLLGLCFLAATHIQHRRHTKQKEEYQKYYHMMDHHLRVFSIKQIENATNNFDEANVLGGGGQGKVYKGLLENNQVVAIKKAKEVHEAQRGEFVNEILLLSQINHKNVVRLLGCCLEVKIPMLIYEFVPNGTLFELLHGKSKNRPISLGTRLRIALESGEALDYLHSSISRSILHGDVKSANILLEDDYQAKISDFGASNLVPVDDTQVVKVVQGTRGYLDPEYVATAVLTKKSDVYSFGVVLLELITRKCAIFRDETSERKNLASCFVSNASKKKLHELLDKEIVTNNEKVIEVLQEVSDLAVWCLNVRGEDRPTMRQVVEKLNHLERFHSSLLGLETASKETESLLGGSSPYCTPDTSSAFHSTGYSSVLEIETRVPR